MASHATLEITDDNFKDLIDNTDQPVVIDFWAAWCGPCRMVSPLVEQIADEFKDSVRVGKVDIAINPVVSMEYKITKLPTILIVKQGKIVYENIGLITRNELKKQVELALGN